MMSSYIVRVGVLPALKAKSIEVIEWALISHYCD